VAPHVSTRCRPALDLPGRASRPSLPDAEMDRVDADRTDTDTDWADTDWADAESADTDRAPDITSATRRSATVFVTGYLLALLGSGAAGWVAVDQVPQLYHLSVRAQAPVGPALVIPVPAPPLGDSPAGPAAPGPSREMAGPRPLVPAAPVVPAPVEVPQASAAPPVPAPVPAPVPQAASPVLPGAGAAQDADLGAAPMPVLSGRVASSLPSELIDVSHWYLTLPTGTEGDPDTVEGSQLAGYHSPYYQLTPARNGVVFTAATAGATTSGSKYPRSELREMVGSEKASWDGRRGRHTMDIVEAITRTPSAKPDVVAGQIHATSDDLMQIHLSGRRLTVMYDDGHKSVDLDPNYQLGTLFAVRIESAEGRVRVWYNGGLKADLPISSPTSYFKAGAYTNSNPSKGDSSGVGQVVITSLVVRHSA
jgi:hypothetical protein